MTIQSDTTALNAGTLPVLLTPFIGRDADQKQVADLLTSGGNRLVTIVGAGGSGKTRLALAVGDRLRAAYPDGIYFVALETVQVPENIAPAIAAAIGMQLHAITEPETQILRFLQTREILLIVDNVEQLVPRVTFLTDVLRSAPGTRMLTTSREPLHLVGEHVYRLAGFPLPGPSAPANVTRDATDALRLFAQSAQRVDASFAPTAADRDECVQICRLVDGLPLGIELAASWVAHLTCAEILAELSRDPAALTSPYTDVPERHRSLEAVIAHSWELLTPDERSALSYLSVFSDGFTREAAHDVASASLATIAALVDKSLVQRTGTGRYRLHDLVRRFAHDRLTVAGQRERARNRHVTYFVTLAEASEPQIMGPEQFVWLPRLVSELDNIRAALAWSCEQPGRVRDGLCLVGALGWFWYFASLWQEGIRWADELVLHCPPGDAIVERARALYTAGGLAVALDYHAAAEAKLTESYAVFRDVQDGWRAARALSLLGVSRFYQGRFTEAERVLRESLALFEGVAAEADALFALEYLGQTLMEMGQLDDAHRILKECLQRNQRLGYSASLSPALIDLARVGRALGDLTSAAEHLDVALAMARDYGIARYAAMALCQQAWIALVRGRLSDATQRFLDCLRHYQEVGEPLGTAEAVEGLAVVGAARADWHTTARLMGAANGLRSVTGVPRSAVDQPPYESATRATRAALGARAFATACTAGERESLEFLIAEVASQSVAETLPVDAELPDGLTPREAEVLRLMAAGRSSKQIAEALVISITTVNRHISNIYGKTGAHGRAAATAYALSHQMLRPTEVSC